MGGPALRYAGASRPVPGESANGDQWLVQERTGSIRVAVIDGLGHGPEAEAASLAAIAELTAAPDLGPVEVLVRCDRALRGTRGAAGSVVVIDPSRKRLEFAGVGNVEGQVFGANGEQHFSPTRGILGRGIRAPRLLEFALEDDWAVVLYSDGIRTSEMSALVREAGERSAEDILRTWARKTDDATIVVVRGQLSPGVGPRAAV